MLYHSRHEFTYAITGPKKRDHILIGLSAPYPPEFEPVHFVMAEKDSLLSYATDMKLNIPHVNQDYDARVGVSRTIRETSQ